MSIILLDDNTISKISAGEIIENPASIVKELLENSIDAGARNVTVELRNSPTEFLRVTDDGEGFSLDEIEKAFLRHSTSKIKEIEDLQSLYTLGFRGEALASISSISKIKLLTKREGEISGTSSTIINGKITDKSNVGMTKGSTFYVEDIFYNTPVRKKFLNNDKYEFSLIFDLVQKIALGTPDVSINLIKDGKTLLKSYETKNFKDHILNILGREIAGNLIEKSFASETYKIKAYFSNNKLFRSNRNFEYIYINGRFVRNRDISKEIEKAYKSLIPLNRFPVFILFIDIDPKLIDVNIHPKKHEVKLSDDNNLLAILREMIDEVLYPNRSLREIKEEKNQKNLNVFQIFIQENGKKCTNEENIASSENLDLKNSEKTFELKSLEDNPTLFEDSNLDKNFFIAAENTNEFFKEESKEGEEDNFDDITSNGYKEINNNSFLMDEEVIDKNLLNTRIVGILFNTFIILENKDKKILYLVDQHAAHERVMYEKYKNQYLNEKINSQILLKPEIIELTGQEFLKLSKYYNLFEKLGFSIEAFGENAIILREVPMIFGMPTYVNFIRDIISSLDDNIKTNYEADMYKVMKRACKKAVKAGDILSDLEVKELIKSLIRCENPYTCPHGRPTIIDIKEDTIAKLFLRE
ncbi:DNA mismatch repair endonuclease MutL [Peptoniphilus raoultii]|uniref:DNA mismatch repair endonuclease MutL n=1 Tax=Peptoniphilus raoultii TaxID=1776387 RepID=UPI0008D93F5B|nr:DNA mismatch repair endonuclease MutL [Peptoniphilus raoultii]